MPNNPRTAADWLAIPKDKLGGELAKVFTPSDQWEHNCEYGFWNEAATMNMTLRCKKCKLFEKDIKRGEPSETCSVPDPIKIDWNTAMEWFRKSNECFGQIREIYFIICQETVNRPTFPWWTLYETQPHHYLIAAAMVAESRA